MLLKALLVQLAAAQELVRFGCSQLTIDHIDSPRQVFHSARYDYVGGAWRVWDKNKTEAARERERERENDKQTDRRRSGCTNTRDLLSGFIMLLVGEPRDRAAKEVPPRGLPWRCESNMPPKPVRRRARARGPTRRAPRRRRAAAAAPVVLGRQQRGQAPTTAATSRTRRRAPWSRAAPARPAHPAQTPQVMYEAIFVTCWFNVKAADGSQACYLSMGDNTGYSIHGNCLFRRKAEFCGPSAGPTA